MGLHTILVAIDGSDHAEHALQTAIDLARHQPARLVLLHVVHPLATVSMSTGSDDYEQLEHVHISTADVLRAMGDRVVEGALRACGAAGVPATSIVRAGDPTRVIVEAATDEDADLVVLGSRGLSDAKGLLLGSVSHKVISTAPTPVLVAR